jgi:hypothetical protein
LAKRVSIKIPTPEWLGVYQMAVESEVSLASAVEKMAGISPNNLQKERYRTIRKNPVTGDVGYPIEEATYEINKEFLNVLSLLRWYYHSFRDIKEELVNALFSEKSIPERYSLKVTSSIVKLPKKGTVLRITLTPISWNIEYLLFEYPKILSDLIGYGIVSSEELLKFHRLIDFPMFKKCVENIDYVNRVIERRDLEGRWLLYNLLFCRTFHWKKSNDIPLPSPGASFDFNYRIVLKRDTSGRIVKGIHLSPHPLPPTENIGIEIVKEPYRERFETYIRLSSGYSYGLSMGSVLGLIQELWRLRRDLLSRTCNSVDEILAPLKYVWVMSIMIYPLLAPRIFGVYSSLSSGELSRRVVERVWNMYNKIH